MSEFIEDPDDPIFDERAEDNEDIRKLRGNARRAASLARDNATLTERNSTLERQVAFGSAGLNLTEKQQAALLAAHGTNDLTADALRATAVELGFAQAETDEGQQQRDEALAGVAKVSAATTGANPPAPRPPIHDQIAQAEAEKDWPRAQALKAQMLTAALMSSSSSVPLA